MFLIVQFIEKNSITTTQFVLCPQLKNISLKKQSLLHGAVVGKKVGKQSIHLSQM